MTEKQWAAFCSYKDELKKLCAKWLLHADELTVLQKKAAALNGGACDYSFETAVVYNSDYDAFTKDDEIHLFVVGDNPGKEEQLKQNRRYLCGQSGRLARGFFLRNEELETDFTRNVLIMNKTPIHTAKTVQLNYLFKNGSSAIKNMIIESQILMAKLGAKLHYEFVTNVAPKKLVPQLWLVGYSELKPNGLFKEYRETLKSEYKKLAQSGTDSWQHVFVYQHFSMNRFTIDLKNFSQEHPQFSLKQNLIELGHLHRDEIFK